MIYQFNHIKIDSDNFKLIIDQHETPVEPQVFNLIVLLIENADRVVSRDFILEKIWQGKIVSDTSITNHIKSARKILGDDGVKQQIIKTIHSRGYQFVADLKDNKKETDTVLKPNRLIIYAAGLSITLFLLFILVTFHNKYELNQSVQRIANYQEISYVTFIAQAKRRNELVAMIEARIGEKRDMQFEKYFSYYFEKLNNEEMFVFEQIRGMTEVGLYQNNLKIVNELNSNPQIIELIPDTKALQQHLEFWLNKYHSIFKQREDMCLLYVGVEDGVPYPNEVNNNIKNWLERQQ